MVLQRKSSVLGNLLLSTLDLGIEELLHTATLQADQMVMVLTFIEFVHRLARLELAALEQASLLKLGQHAIDRSQTHIMPSWKISSTLSRGSVDFSPMLFNSLDVGTACSSAAAAAPPSIAYHSGLP